MEEATTPQALQQGDTIAFVSPSGRLNDIWPSALERATKYIETLGFRVEVIFTSPLSEDHATQIAQRCNELHQAFSSPHIKAIICTSGGNTSSELLQHLDYDLIRANPKIFCGYSDITNLHGALYSQAQLRTFYGPTALLELAEFPKPIDFTTSHFLHVLSSSANTPIGAFPRSEQWAPELSAFITGADKAAEIPRSLIASPTWKWFREGSATGPILGGVLTAFLSLAGSKYFPPLKGAILLLESSFGAVMGSPAPIQKTREQLVQLANMGVFEQVKGVVFGRLVGANLEGVQEEFEKVLGGVLDVSGFQGPVLLNVDVGHTDPILTIPLGGLVRLDSTKGEFVGLEPGVVSKQVFDEYTTATTPFQEIEVLSVVGT